MIRLWRGQGCLLADTLRWIDFSETMLEPARPRAADQLRARVVNLTARGWAVSMPCPMH